MKTMLAGLFLAVIGAGFAMGCSSSQKEATTPTATTSDAAPATTTTTAATPTPTAENLSGNAMDPKVLDAIRAAKEQPTNTCAAGTHACASNQGFVCLPDAITGCPTVPANLPTTR